MVLPVSAATIRLSAIGDRQTVLIETAASRSGAGQLELAVVSMYLSVVLEGGVAALLTKVEGHRPEAIQVAFECDYALPPGYGLLAGRADAGSAIPLEGLAAVFSDGVDDHMLAGHQIAAGAADGVVLGNPRPADVLPESD
ncbi:hypothetical protein [Gordonia westfalica]|uniref:hypothetical protein n=1 Tax=Gordonia westfalica TaxID=158898 RepID=UPI00094467F8|nr:hypothetical protein [Gordonia westfalica]